MSSEVPAIKTQKISFEIEVTGHEAIFEQYEQLREVHTGLLKQMLWITDPSVKLVCCTQVETAPRQKKTHAEVELPCLNKENVMKQSSCPS